MDRERLENEKRRLERSINSRKSTISAYEDQKKSAEAGLDDLETHKIQVNAVLEEEKTKWFTSMSKSNSPKYIDKKKNDIARIYEGERYYNMNNKIAAIRSNLNDKIIELDELIDKERTYLEQEQEELKKVNEQLSKLEEQEHGVG